MAQSMVNLLVTPPTKPVRTEIELPASKSISNRLLILRWLSGDAFSISNISEADDTKLLKQILDETLHHSGQESPIEINCRNAGTVLRFLSACLSFRKGRYLITGSEQMLQRPIGPLVEALHNMGVDIRYLNNEGFPPFIITGNPDTLISRTEIDASMSSQFVSALMMAGCTLPHGLTIELKGEKVSEPYLQMTRLLMQQAGAETAYHGNQIKILPGFSPTTRNIHVEPDWSSAAFWYQIAALAPGSEIFLKGLKNSGLQGDAVLHGIFESFGVVSDFLPDAVVLRSGTHKAAAHFEYDFRHCPDLVQPVAVTSVAMGVEARLKGIRNLRYKETNRISALMNELANAGYNSKLSKDDGLLISGQPRHIHQTEPVEIETYGDHRMAMSFAPLTLRTGSLIVRNASVVAKSYPDYWDHLANAGFQLSAC